jgi:16S rRNA (cytosine1402-N4)-methyltransferase
MMTEHRPVLLEESLEALAPSSGDTVIDATFGGGGHTQKILDSFGPDGQVIAIDHDPEAVERAGVIEDRRFTFAPGAYDEVLVELLNDGFRADAILFDLGLSSYQIDSAERGFSYVQEGPLDMRMDPTRGISAAEFLNTVDAENLARVLSEYGDVARGEARRVTNEVVRRRPLSTTLDLTEAVRAAVGWAERGGHPAKRVFQAIRVHVNDELGGLLRALEAAERLLSEGGRLVVITFQSGEDWLVKRFIASRTGRCVCPPELPVCVCGVRPIFRKGSVKTPSDREIEENPRSGSARLRLAQRTWEPLEEGPG